MGGITVRLQGFNYRDNEWMPVRIDPTDQAAVQISGPHYAIHKKISYTLVKTSQDLDTDGIIDIRIQPPAPAKGLQMHLTVEAAANGLALFTMYNKTGKTHVGGNAIVPVNRDLGANSPASQTTVCHTPAGAETVSALTDPIVIGGTGTGNKGAPGAARGVNEWLPDPYQPLRFQIESKVDNNYVSLKLDWYEKEDIMVFSTTTTTTTTTTGA